VRPANIRLDFRLAGCDPSGLQPGFSTLQGLTVRYTVLGRTRSVQAPFEKLVLAVHSSGTCDHSFLND